MTSGETKLEMQKIHEAKFAGGLKAVFAFAGEVDAALIFQDVFSRLAEAKNVTSSRTIADTAEEAVKETKAKILDGFKHPAFTPEQAREHLKKNACEILLAYAFEHKPYIFRLTLEIAVAIPETNKSFSTVGSARNIAAFFLNAFPRLREINLALASALAVYVIVGCKSYDLFCSGKCQLSWIFIKEGGIHISHKDNPDIDTLEASAIQAHRKINAELGHKIVKEFSALKHYPNYNEPPFFSDDSAEPSSPASPSAPGA